jgi:hypothetical protein
VPVEILRKRCSSAGFISENETSGPKPRLHRERSFDECRLFGGRDVIRGASVAADLRVVGSDVVDPELALGTALVEPAARSRLNAVLIGIMFVGMASGAALGAEALSLFGWRGVCAVGGAAALLALAVRLVAQSSLDSA